MLVASLSYTEDKSPGSAAGQDQAIVPDVPFNEKEFEPYKRKGTGTVSGQAFLASRNKEARYNPGGFVVLVPVTPYTAAWFGKALPHTRNCHHIKGDEEEEALKTCIEHLKDFLWPSDQRIKPYVRVTRSNPVGEFVFSKIPPGKYYIAAIILWPVPQESTPAGGIAVASVEVEPGEHVQNVIVSY